MLDFISQGGPGSWSHVHLLLISAAELGFAWDGDEKGWVRVSLHSPAYDDWSTFSLCYFECLALSCGLLGFLKDEVF